MSKIVNSPLKPLRSEQEGSRDLSIDYLRTTLTLMVLAHHSSLAYVTFANFDKLHMFRSSAPVVDSMRWAFFDYAENFNDVFFMSLMFLVSGLFVYPALRKHGTLRFIRDRLLRLGVPFAFAVVFLMPVAYYASWQLTGRSVGFIDFYEQVAGFGFAAGPPWFIWVLLAFDVILALLLIPLNRIIPAVGNWMWKLQDYPFATFFGIFVLAVIAYLPLMAISRGAWTYILIPAFSFQISRIALYGLWFLFGVLIGIPGFARGLLSREGGLVRRWPLWVLGCIIAYNALWFIPKLPVFQNLPLVVREISEVLLWTASCVASSFGFLALFRGIKLTSRGWMNSLSRCAYVMYLVHYVYVLWMQRLMMDLPIHAAIKFLVVFLSTVLLSWLTAQLALRIPGLKSIL
jgi:glucans biosynthesis protein C